MWIIWVGGEVREGGWHLFRSDWKEEILSPVLNVSGNIDFNCCQFNIAHIYFQHEWKFPLFYRSCSHCMIHLSPPDPLSLCSQMSHKAFVSFLISLVTFQTTPESEISFRMSEIHFTESEKYKGSVSSPRCHHSLFPPSFSPRFDPHPTPPPFPSLCSPVVLFSLDVKDMNTNYTDNENNANFNHDSLKNISRYFYVFLCIHLYFYVLICISMYSINNNAITIPSFPI